MAENPAQPSRGVPARGDIRERPLLGTAPLRSLVRRAASILVLLVLDLSALTLGLYGALILREFYYGRLTPLWGILWDAEASWLPFLTLITALVFWRAGLYAPREQRAGAGRIFSSLALVTVITLAFGLGTGYRFSTFGLFPTAFVLCGILISAFRASYEALTRDLWRLLGVRRRVVLLGEGEHLVDLRRMLGTSRGGIAYDFVGVVTSDDGDATGLPVLGSLAALPGVLEERQIDELIVTDSDFDDRQLLELVDEAHRQGVQVRIAPKTTELLRQRAEYVPGLGAPLFALRPPVFAGVDWAIKRAFDVIVSAIIVVVGLPLWIAVAAAIKLTSPGPVFYRDRRVGLHENEFGMLKFRTMYADAAQRQAGLEGSNEAQGPLFKIKNDPRVTPVGRFLRRLSLDEVPQVLNVVHGEMSLVGPRPLPLRDYLQLEDWHRKRYLVLPGMTGLWQVSGRIDLPFDDLVRLDFYYLENWSIWLDISILAKTLPAVVARRGAY